MPEATPTVSVVMPAYNAEAYLKTALDSLFAQHFEDFEVVVVNDGSTDGTVDILSSYEDSRLKVFHQDNAGQSAAINFGVSRTQGSYIKIVDADDALNPEHLSELAKRAAPDTVVSCRWACFRQNVAAAVVRAEVADRNYDHPLEWLVDSLTKDEGMMGGWRWLIPRPIWDAAGGYDSRLTLNNDFHFSVVTLLAAERVQTAVNAIYYYRTGVSGSLSGTNSHKAMDSAFLTTKLGTDALLNAEDSPRIRKLCANRFQLWLFQLFPDFPDLAEQAEASIKQLGGSDLPLEGGRLLKLLQPLMGWKNVRRLQSTVYKLGWQKVLQAKAEKRLSKFE